MYYRDCFESTLPPYIHYCNPFHTLGHLPYTHVFLVMLTPLISMSLCNDGKSFPSAMLCCLWNVVWLCVSQTYAAANTLYQFYWFLIIACIISKCIFDVEEMHRTSFQRREEKHQWAEQQIQNNIELEKARMTSIRLEMANVAHDLRTPLFFIASSTEYVSSLIEQEKVEGHNIEDILSTMRDVNLSCDFMNVKINRFLDVSKSYNNIELKPRKGSFDVLKSIKWAVSMISTRKKNLDIQIESSGSVPVASKIISDKAWFEENILCYLSNSTKHTPENGSITVRYFLTESKSANSIYNATDGDNKKLFLVIEVQDTGVGIPEHVREKLFKPFAQAQSSAGGTGLGLYSLALRCEALGGSYGIKGKGCDSGACFFFSIPYTADDDDYYTSLNCPTNELSYEATHPSTEDTLLKAYSEFNYFGSEKELLVVDDNSQILKIILRSLKNLRMCKVDSAPDGYEALEKMKAKPAIFTRADGCPNANNGRI